jgi:hypothetical protein
MGFVYLHCFCIACKAPLACNPVKVPSLVVNGQREPLCRSCFARWNELHRTSKGLDPIPLEPDAYEACDEREL